ncbi:hypothetical protein PHSY_005922 [Pseudozyma hubeiensis SY62]|uniref:Uncharacterized protein n=1 Tax=Pseudozyma hubeiensis (strain SY62) TaxID=1305764 RepID=R9PAH1_PSEHS|nr:hypothetical protein PHSY_005922 [Pseudozyma hubeiensis SY62]GAC98329.1 hypothetical protein PHSY_005922 [Pseudozyma hubeiensis SY62]
MRCDAYENGEIAPESWQTNGKRSRTDFHIQHCRHTQFDESVYPASASVCPRFCGSGCLFLRNTVHSVQRTGAYHVVDHALHRTLSKSMQVEMRCPLIDL